MTEQQEERIMNAIMDIKRYSLLAARNVLNLDDVALLTGLSKSHLYKLTCTKKIPHYKPNSKSMYFDRAELEAWMKQNRVTTQAEAEQYAIDYIVSKQFNNDESNTYIAMDENTRLYKIGRSIDVERRISGLRCANPGIKLIAYLEKDIERELHQKLKDFHVVREWFEIPVKVLKKIIEEYGFNVDSIET